MTERDTPAGLRPGTPAPPFALRDTPHSRVRLQDYRGRAVVLVFHVADWHPVAMDQVALLAASRAEFDRLGASVLAISVDSTWSHGAMARATETPFPILADDDPPGAVARAYGVFDAASGRSRRALFVIDPAGIVRWSATVPDAVNPGVDGMLSVLEALAVPKAVQEARAS